MRFVFTLLTFILTVGSSIGQVANERLGLITDSIRKVYNIPGIAVALVYPDAIITATSGTKRVDKKSPITLDSKFHLGSNTKAITAYIALQLAQDHRIELSTRFFSLFPELITNSDVSYHKITLQQLLQHQAGIPAFTSGSEFDSLPDMNGNPSQNRYHFASIVLAQQPVEINTYSNAGYALASLMLEKVSGKSFEMLVEELCTQLNIEHCIGLPNRKDSMDTWGHWKENNKLIPLPPNHNYNLPDYLTAAGDVSMSIDDYASWMQLHVRAVSGHYQFLDSNAYRMMHFSGSSHGLGWGNQSKPIYLSYHDGTTGTFYAHAIITPVNKLGIAILTNVAEKEHIAGIYALRKALMLESGRNGKN